MVQIFKLTLISQYLPDLLSAWLISCCFIMWCLALPGNLYLPSPNEGPVLSSPGSQRSKVLFRWYTWDLTLLYRMDHIPPSLLRCQAVTLHWPPPINISCNWPFLLAFLSIYFLCMYVCIYLESSMTETEWFFVHLLMHSPKTQG